jgi:bifunctional UDP-N-acetylglucosamine pyrophosphorylase / glucosamine-1-phosphate N-acetyltransferase
MDAGAAVGAMPLLAPMSDQRRFAVVILAAGQGTRMRSDTHKVLHPIASQPLLLHLLDRVDALGADKRVVVVGKGRDQVEKTIAGRDVVIAVQAEQKGTGHAVQQAEQALAGYDGPVIVLYGDTPFVETATLRRMLDRLDGDGGPGVVVLASSPEDPLKYGRIKSLEWSNIRTQPTKIARCACATPA